MSAQEAAASALGQSPVRGDNVDEILRLRDALADAEYQCARWVAEAASQERRADELSQALADATAGRCRTCHGTGTLMVPDSDGTSASEQACPDPVHDSKTLGEIYWDAYRGEPRRSGWSVPHSSFDKISDAHRAAVEIGAHAVAAHVTGGYIPPATPSHSEWAVFWGGEHPDDCAGSDVYGDEADADENCRWIIGGGLATRPVWHGPWTIVRPSAAGRAPGEDPDDNLTEADREEYRQWRAVKGLR